MSTARALVLAGLHGAATRLGGWRPPHGEDRASAIAELRRLGGDDTGVYAEAVGIMLGAHPIGSSSYRRFRNGANLLLAAAGIEETDPRVQQAKEEGKRRQQKGLAALRAGDHWDRRR